MVENKVPCLDKTELFFSPHPTDVAAARAICWSKCPFRERCLEYALDHHQRIGTWGGESGRRRRQLQRQRLALKT
jgi:WhiB family redox-sensing transcriptional regulator